VALAALAVAVLLGSLAAGSATAGALPSLFPAPANDVFYTPPAGYGNLPNGTVLRSRGIVATALSVPLPVSSWQVLYKSTDATDQPTTEVTTVMVPLLPWLGGGHRPVVAYQSAEDSVDTSCSPSYSLRAGISTVASNSSLETSLIATALLRGWAVVTSDYEGPDSQFLAGPLEGHGVLDGIRAAMAFAPAGLAGSPVGLWGYSGGAFASAWAAEMAPEYAPELRFVGLALGGFPADLETAMRQIDGGYGSGLIMGGLIGLQRAYPDSGMASLFTASGAQRLAAGGHDCTDELLLRYLFTPVHALTVSPTPYDTPTLHRVLAANSPLGKGNPTVPVYDYHALGDELVPVSIADAAVAQYCQAGLPVQKVRYVVGEHITTMVTGAPAAETFLAQRFAGKKPVSDCP
jgi:hypothetical protein